MDFDMFNKDDSTKMVNDELSCNKYKYNSCPKEIIDFLNQVYLQEIKNIDPGRSFFPASALSDFSEKSRQNGMKQAASHFLLILISSALLLFSILSFMEFGLLLENGEPNIPTEGLFGVTLIIVFFSIMNLHFYWYGQLNSMQLGTSTTQIVKATYPVFRNWYISLIIVFLIATLGIMNIPNMIQGLIMELVAHLQTHEQVWSGVLGESYQTFIIFAQKIDPAYIQNVVLIADGIVIFLLVGGLLSAKLGYKRGFNEQVVKNDEEKEIEKRKGEYVFDRALRELDEF